MSFLKKVAVKYQVMAAAKKTFTDPRDPKVVYIVEKTGNSQGRGVYEITTDGHILGDAYGKDELEGLKNYLSSRGMSDTLLKKLVSAKVLPKAGTPEAHQHKIALDTVKNPAKGLLGGPTADEAEKTLMTKFKYTKDEIESLKK